MQCVGLCDIVYTNMYCVCTVYVLCYLLGLLTECQRGYREGREGHHLLRRDRQACCSKELRSSPA